MMNREVLLNAVLTVFIYGSCLVQGMTSSLFGASLLDLSEILNSSVADVATLGSTQAGGSIVGALFSGPVYASFNARHLLLIAGLVKGISLIVLPLSGSLTFAHIASACYGCTIPFNEAGSYILLLDIQAFVRPSISTLVQGYHLMFAIGSGLAPLIVRPFVSNSNPERRNGRAPNVTSVEGTSNFTDDFSLGSQTNSEANQIFIPYAIIGGLAILVGASFCTVRPNHPGQRNSEGQSETNGTQEEGPRNQRRLWLLVVFTAIHAFLYVHIFVSVIDYLAVFAVLKGVPKSDSVLYLSAFFSTFSGFRLVPVILSTRLRPGTLLLIVDFALLCCTTTMYLFGGLGPTHLWYCTLALGATMAPIYGSGNAWLLSQGRLTRIQTGTLFTASSFGAVLPSFIVGRWIEHHPSVFPIVPFLSTFVLCIIMVVMLISSHMSHKLCAMSDPPSMQLTQMTANTEVSTAGQPRQDQSKEIAGTPKQ